MKTIYVVHKGIGHTSPYMSIIKQGLTSLGYKVLFIDNIDAIKKTNSSQEVYVYFHRLGRMYDNMDYNSAKSFIKSINSLKKQNIKIIWTIHNFYPLDRVPNPVDDFVLRKLGLLSDHIFTHTDTMQKNAENLFKRSVINHGYGLIQSTAVPNHSICFPNLESSFNLCFWGNIRDYKDMNLLINSFVKFHIRCPKTKLLIIGPIYKNYYFDKLFDSEFLHRHEIFVANEYCSNINSILNKIDGFICTYKTSMPNFKYGFYPSSIATLSQYDLPIICPKCDSVIDIIGSENNAFLYEAEQELSLLETMNNLYAFPDNQRIQVAENLKKLTSKKSWDNVIKIIQNTIE